MPSPDAVQTLLKARRAGNTLRWSAVLAGVHVATVCRWQARDPALRKALADAAREAKDRRKAEPRPQVRWRRDCPLCKAKVVVRTARGRRFWRCGRWPECPWASWRPRAPRNCRRCGAARFWSHSRLSVGCSGCGVRTMCL
jgi:hypothetical protein